MQKNILSETDIVLRLSYLGYPGKFNLQDVMDWMYREYQIIVDKDNNFYKIYYGTKLLLIVRLKDCDIFCALMDIILKLWKCEDGILSGPSIENFEEPDVEWT